MSQYESKFFKLLPYVDYLKDEKLLINRFIRGLKVRIVGPVRMVAPGSLRVVMEKALNGSSRGDSGYITGHAGSTSKLKPYTTVFWVSETPLEG